MASLIFSNSAITIKNNALMAVLVPLQYSHNYKKNILLAGLVFKNSAINIKNNALMARLSQNYLRFGVVKNINKKWE